MGLSDISGFAPSFGSTSLVLLRSLFYCEVQGDTLK